MVALGIPGGTDTPEAVPLVALALGPGLFVDVDRAGTVEAVTHFGDVALRGRLSARGALGPKLRKEGTSYKLPTHGRK